MIYSLYINLLTYGTFNNKGFVKGLSMVASCYFIGFTNLQGNFCSIFNCLIIRRINFGQNTLNCGILASYMVYCVS